MKDITMLGIYSLYSFTKNIVYKNLISLKKTYTIKYFF